MAYPELYFKKAEPWLYCDREGNLLTRYSLHAVSSDGHHNIIHALSPEDLDRIVILIGEIRSKPIEKSPDRFIGLDISEDYYDNE